MVTDRNIGGGAPSIYLHEPVNEQRALITDAAVKRLPRRPRICVWQQYIRGGTREQKARTYGCSAAEFYRDLAAAEALVEEFLQS